MKTKNHLALYLLSIILCCYQQIASMHRIPSGISSAAAERASQMIPDSIKPSSASSTDQLETLRQSDFHANINAGRDFVNLQQFDDIEETKDDLPSQAETVEEIENKPENESSIVEKQQSPRPTETSDDKKPTPTERLKPQGPSENVYGESTIQGSGNPIDLSNQINAFKNSSVGKFLGFKDESVHYSDEQKEQLKIILSGRLDNEGRRDLAITLRQAWSSIEKDHPDLVQNLLDGFNGKTDVKMLEESISDLKELLLELQPSQPKTPFSPAALYPKASTKKQMWQRGFVPNVQKQAEPVSQPQTLRMISTKSKTKFIPKEQREIIKNFNQLPGTDLAPTDEQEGKYKAAIVLKQLNDKREKELAKIAEELKTLEIEQEEASQEMKKTEELFHKELTKEIKKSEIKALEMQQLREQLESVARQNFDQSAQNNLEKLYNDFSQGLQSAAQLSKNEQERIQDKEQLLQKEIDERNKLAKKLNRSKQMAAYKQDLREMNERSAVEDRATTEKQLLKSEYDRLLQAEKQARQIAIQRQLRREQEEKAQKDLAAKDEKNKKQKELFDQKRKNEDRRKDVKEERKKETTELQEQKARDAAIKREEKGKQDSLDKQQEKEDRNETRKQSKQKKDLNRQQKEESETRAQIEKELRDLQEAISKDIEASETKALEMQHLRNQREDNARQNIDQRAQINLKNLYDEFEQGLQTAAREALTDRQQIATKQTERKELEQSAQRDTDYLTNEEDHARSQIIKNFETSKKQALTKQRSREMNERSTIEEQATTEKQQMVSEYDRLLQDAEQNRQIAAQRQHRREQEEKAQKDLATKDEKNKKQKKLYEQKRNNEQRQKDSKKEIEKESKKLQKQKTRDAAIKRREEGEQASLKNQQEKLQNRKSRKQKKEEKDLKRQQNEESANRDQIEKELQDLQESINRDIKASKQAALEKQRDREIAEQFSKLPGNIDLEPTDAEQNDYNEIIKNELRRKISEEKIKLDDLTKDQTPITTKVFNSTRPMFATKKNPQHLPQEIKEEKYSPTTFASPTASAPQTTPITPQPKIFTSTPPEPATTTPQTQTYASTQAPAPQPTTSQPSNTTPPASTYAKQPVPKSYAKEPFSDQAAEAVHSMFTENEEPPASASNPEPFHFETTPTPPEPAKAMQPDISSEETTDSTNDATPDNEDNSTPDDAIHSDSDFDIPNNDEVQPPQDKITIKKSYKKPSSKSQKVYYQNVTTPHQDPASQTTTPAPIAPTTTEPLEQTPQSTDTTPPYPEDFNINDLLPPQEQEIITEPEQPIDIIETESIPSSDNLPDLTYLAPQEQISSRSKLMQPDITITTPQPFFAESIDDEIIPTTSKIVQRQKEDKKTIKQITSTQSKPEIKTVPQPSWWEKITTSVQSWWNDIKSWYIKKIS